MIIQFWSNDPTILFNKDNIFQLWPTPKMTFEEKLNAISRLVLFLTIIGFIFLMSTKFLFVGIGTLIIIFILYKTRKQKIIKVDTYLYNYLIAVKECKIAKLLEEYPFNKFIDY